MQIFIGSDHRGFPLKEFLKQQLAATHEVHDLGALTVEENDDYPQYGFAVGEAVTQQPGSLGIVICGSGAGIAIAANKIKGVRCTQGFLPEQVAAARRDDNINVLALASDFIGESEAQQLVEVFVSQAFHNEDRYLRRIRQIQQREGNLVANL